MHSTSSHRSIRPAPGKRGSVLLVSVIVGTGLALTLGSFVAIALNSAKLSRQSYFANSALNLAEAGLEQALYAMNTNSYSGGWTAHGATGANSRYKVTGSLDLGQGAVGEIKVLIYDINATQRHIVAQGRVVPTSGPPLVKQIDIWASRRSLFANGLVAKDQLTFNSNTATVDSWNSDPDNNPATAPIAYSNASKRDNGSVASNAVTVTIGNADVWGFVGTGGGDPEIKNNGTIAAFGQAVGTYDASRVDKTFKQDFPPITAPVVASNTITDTIDNSKLPLTLPGAGDFTSIDPADGVAKYFYKLPGIDASGNVANILTIAGNVVLLPTAGSGASSVKMAGNASITIAANASLAIYTEGDVSISGNGVINGGTTAATANQPKNFQLWGTNTSPAGQSISISGNGVVSGIGYAPNGTFTVNGGGSSGDVQGAFVAKTVNMNGGVVFHYDESLKNFGAKNPFGLTSWRELFAGEHISF